MILFATPLFLLAALAGGIPFVLHMIHKRRAPQIYFSTLRFLRISAERTARRRRIQDLLLMLLRMAVVVLLACALSRPILSEVSLSLGSSHLAAVIIMDNSQSMAMKHEGGTRYEIGKKLVADMLRGTGDVPGLQDGDAAAIVLTNPPPGRQAEQLYRDLEVPLTILEESQPAAEMADISRALARAYELLDKSRLPNKEVYCITDLQKASWAGVKRFLDGNQNVPDDIPVVVVDVGRVDFQDAAIVSHQVINKVPVAGMPVQVDVQVQNNGDEPLDRYAKLFLNNRELKTSEKLALGPGQKRTVTFQFQLAAAGIQSGRVQIAEEDSLPDNNQCYFAMNVKEKIPVCVCKTSVAVSPLLDDGFFLRQVFQVSGAAKVTQITAAQVATEGDLRRFVAVFCANVGPLNAAQKDNLRRYVQTGGNLVWFVGGQTRMHPAGQDPADDLMPARLVAVIGDSVAREKAWAVQRIDGDDPWLTEFKAPPSLYQSILAYRYVRMDVPKNSPTRVLAWFQGGDPFLVVKGVGAGRVFCFAVSAQRDWSNFPLRPVYPPLMNTLLYSLTSQADSGGEFVAGAPARFSFPDSKQAVEVEISPVLDDRHRDTITSELRTRTNEAQYEHTQRPGVYKARVVKGARGRRWAFAINADAREALRADKADFHELRAELPLRQVKMASDAESLAGVVERIREGSQLWEMVLILALIAAVAEVWVSNRFRPQGKKGQTGPKAVVGDAADAIRHLTELQEAETGPGRSD